MTMSGEWLPRGRGCVCSVEGPPPPRVVVLRLSFMLLSLVDFMWSDLICRLRFDFWANALSHRKHTKGFSPVCVRMCAIMFDLCAKNFRQKTHWCFLIIRPVSV